MTTPRLFDYDAHVKLWLWLAENPLKNKMEWPGWKQDRFGEHSTDTHLYNHCFACFYACIVFELSRCKEACPLDWRSASRFHYCHTRGLYDRWVKSHSLRPTLRNLQKRSELARKIASLPVKLGIPYLPYNPEVQDASVALADDSKITE